MAVIPARGGSKGLPGKNIRPLGGKPLITWTIEAARGARAVDQVILSSDDEAIMAAATAAGCAVPFRRPPELATDEAGSIDVVLHALDAVPGADIVVLLQPTSPLRTAADIDQALDRLAATGAPAVVSVCAVEQNPHWMYRLSPEARLVPVMGDGPGFARRQELPDIFTLNGAIYAARVDWLRAHRSFVTGETVAFVMPQERSLDIDTAADFEACMRALDKQ